MKGCVTKVLKTISVDYIRHKSHEKSNTIYWCKQASVILLVLVGILCDKSRNFLDIMTIARKRYKFDSQKHCKHLLNVKDLTLGECNYISNYNTTNDIIIY